MAKKTFSGLDSMIPSEEQETGTKQGRPKKNFGKHGLPEGETRASIILRDDILEKFKALCYWERRSQKSLLNEILKSYIDKHEKKSGEIEPIPEWADK